MQSKVHSDFLVLPANPTGHDLITGDIHGNLDCLIAVANLLGPHDRLFIGGDLCDRGSQSANVISYLNSSSKKIYCVLGNHDVSTLQYISYLEVLACERNPRFIDDLKTLLAGLEITGYDPEDPLLNSYWKISLQNSPEKKWLLALFLEEWQNMLIIYDGRDQESLHFLPESKIGQTRNYLSKLPYIILVQGLRPFKIVHADMPIPDSVMFRKIAQGKSLTEDEKIYAVWAREYSGVDPVVIKLNTRNRDPSSIVTFVGHTIVIRMSTRIIRRESKTINLDVATYFTDVSLVFNFTLSTCQFVGKGTPSRYPTLLEKKSALDTYLAGEYLVSSPKSEPPSFGKNPVSFFYTEKVTAEALTPNPHQYPSKN